MQVYLDLFLSFFTIGAVSVGGGYAMTQQILDACLTYGWTDLASFNAGVALANMSPGPFGVNMATFLGMKAAGPSGALVATFGMICPSVIIVTAIARFFYGFQDNRHVQGVLAGIRPVVIGLIASAVYTLGKAPMTTTAATRIGVPGNFVAIAIALVMVVAIRKYKINPILCILASAVSGLILYI
ncbi:MAG: chromate transporter [Symbiobacteriaceae bacterium]|nr:chromate transporter [Symbiobacteriaceae bacterium]